MKKFSRATVAALVIACAFNTVSSVSAETKMAIQIDNKPIAVSVEPYIKNGYTLAPLRAVTENLGCDVVWDKNTKEITLKKSNTTIRMKIGDNYAYVNGATMPLDTPPEINNGSTMVPLRFISESLNCTVEWVKEKSLIKITNNAYVPGNPGGTPIGDNGISGGAPVNEDPWGGKTRVTNLPTNSAKFPYIQEAVPNWAYEHVGKMWSNNFYGPMTNTDRPASEKYLLDDPKQLWETAGQGPDIWNKEYGADKDGTVLTHKEAFEKFLNAQLNIDYRTIKDAKDTSTSLFQYAPWLISDLSMTGTKYSLGSYIAGAQNQFIDSKIIAESKFIPMYEASFRPLDGGEFLFTVPVYVKMDIKNLASDKFFTMFGGTAYNYRKVPDNYDEYKSGQTYEGVVYYSMIYTPKYEVWQVSFSCCSPKEQLNPQPMFGGLNPASGRNDKQPTMNYGWMKEGETPIKGWGPIPDKYIFKG